MNYLRKPIVNSNYSIKLAYFLLLEEKPRKLREPANRPCLFLHQKMCLYIFPNLIVLILMEFPLNCVTSKCGHEIWSHYISQSKQDTWLQSKCCTLWMWDLCIWGYFVRQTQQLQVVITTSKNILFSWCERKFWFETFELVFFLLFLTKLNYIDICQEKYVTNCNIRIVTNRMKVVKLIL